MTRRRAIHVEGLAHGAPIPNAAVVGNLLVSGGISGMDPATRAFPPTVEEQVELLFANTGRVMEQAGGSLDDIVKFTFFVLDRGARTVIDPHWTALFPDPESRPARHTLTHPLPEPMLVQCEITAVLA